MAQFLLDLLNRQQIPVSAPDFTEVVDLIQRAKRELTDALRENQQ